MEVANGGNPALVVEKNGKASVEIEGKMELTSKAAREEKLDEKPDKSDLNGGLGNVQSPDGEKKEMESLDGDASHATECGLRDWRPSHLQPFASIWAFTATMSFVTIFGNINYTYYTAVITQIERRFGLSSRMTGFIKNIDNIGIMLTVIVISHYCRYSNKPRLFAGSVTLSAIAIFIFAIPHFIYTGSEFVMADQSAGNTTSPLNWTDAPSQFEFCDGVDESAANPGMCMRRTVLVDFNKGALALFVISELLQGMAAAPKITLSLTYVDDNTAETNSPNHFGVLFAMRAVSPLLGFLLGAWTNHIYVDLTSPDIDERDPRWVGAWWLGFVICACCTIVWMFPLLLFPKRMKGGLPSNTGNGTHTAVDVTHNIKDLTSALWRLLKNPVYMCVLLGFGFNISLIGFSTFIPKYLEYNFGLTASFASIYTGVVNSMSWIAGPIISGKLMTRTKMTPSGCLKFVMGIHVIAGVGYFCALFLQCPKTEWSGTMTFERKNMTLGCNSNCSCDADFYSPVCGSDEKNYFNPCFAGCHHLSSNSTSKKVFLDCQCVADDVRTATVGLCRKPCPVIYLYLAVLFVTSFVTSMMIVPMMTILLRCVDEQDKAMSLGLSAFLTQLLGFPAPVMYGAVIDTVCLVHQTSCTRIGACLLYDQDLFRLRLHGLPVAGKAGAFLMYGCALYFNQRNNKRQNGVVVNKTIEPIILTIPEKEELLPVRETDL